MFMVRRIEVDYLRPARLDDSLTVVTEPLAVGGASATLRQDVRGPDGSCAVLTVRLACVKPGGGEAGPPAATLADGPDRHVQRGAAARNRE